MTPRPYANNLLELDFSTLLYDPRNKHPPRSLELVIDSTKTIETSKTLLAKESLEALGIKAVNHTFHYVRERAQYEADGEEITRKGESRFSSNQDVADLVKEYETLFKTQNDSLDQKAKQFDFAVEYLSKEQIQRTQENLYQTALRLAEKGDYTTALSVAEKLTKKQQILLGQASLAYIKKETARKEQQTTLYNTALQFVQTGNYSAALSSKEKLDRTQQKSLGEAIVEHFLRKTAAISDESTMTALQKWYDWREFESTPDFFQEGNENVYRMGMDNNNKARSSSLMLDNARWAARKDLSSIQIAQALAEYVTLVRAEDNIFGLLEQRTKETAIQARTLAQEYTLPLMRERAEEQLVVHAQFEQERAKISSFQEAARFNLEWLEDGRVAFDPNEIRAPFTFTNALKTGFRKPVFA